MITPSLLRALRALPLLLVLAGCASAQRLGEYDFRDRTLTVMALNTPRPEILAGTALDLDTRSAFQAVVSIGAGIAKEVEAGRARPRLDSAALVAGVEGRMTARLLEGAAREMRARPATDGQAADYELELRIKRYGIDADNFFAPARFRLEAEVTLRESLSGARIWHAKVREDAPIAPSVRGGGFEVLATEGAIGDVVTAARLSSMSVDEMTRVLEALADFASTSVLDHLHRGLEKARR